MSTNLQRRERSFLGPDAQAILKALSVRDVMTREVVTIDVNATVRDAGQRGASFGKRGRLMLVHVLTEATLLEPEVNELIGNSKRDP